LFGRTPTPHANKNGEFHVIVVHVEEGIEVLGFAVMYGQKQEMEAMINSRSWEFDPMVRYDLGRLWWIGC